MLLVVDAGNTHLALGLTDGGRLLATRRVSTGAFATPDELELLLDGVLRLEGRDLGAVTRIVLASVVPAVDAALAAIAARRLVPLVSAGPGSVPMAIRVAHPGEVGPDRLVNAYAALRLLGAPAIVVDLGTATTFDVVAADGAYAGGAIAAGVGLGIEALAARTARLGTVELHRPARAIGRTTVEAMQSGAVFGTLALVRGLLDRMATELSGEAGARPHVAVTGGLSRLPWVRELDGVAVVDPELTLKGLVLLDQARSMGTAPDAAGEAPAAAGRASGLAPGERR